MKSLLTTTALSAFMLTGAAFAQDQQDDGKVKEVEEFIEPSAEQPANVGQLEEDALDEVDEADTLNEVVLDATTQAGDGEVVLEGEDGQRQQTAADSSTTPDRPTQAAQASQADAQSQEQAGMQSELSDTEVDERQRTAINNLIEEKGGQTQTAGRDASGDDTDQSQTAMQGQDDQQDASTYAQQDDDQPGDMQDDEVTTAATFDAEDDMQDVQDAGVTTAAAQDEDGMSMDDDESVADRLTRENNRLREDRDAASQTDYASDQQSADQGGDTYALENDIEPAGIILYEEDRLLDDQRMASDLIGQPIMGSNDDEVGEINDFIVDERGDVAAAVVSAGGILGLGKRSYRVAYDDLEFEEAANGEMRVSSMMTKDEIKNSEEFDRDAFVIGEGGQTLASELRNAELQLAEADETATVNDVIMTDAGAIDAIVVAYDDEEYEVGYDAISVAEGDAAGTSGYRLDYTPDDFANAQSGPMQDRPMDQGMQMDQNDPMTTDQEDTYGTESPMDRQDDMMMDEEPLQDEQDAGMATDDPLFEDDPMQDEETIDSTYDPEQPQEEVDPGMEPETEEPLIEDPNDNR